MVTDVNLLLWRKLFCTRVASFEIDYYGRNAVKRLTRVILVQTKPLQAMGLVQDFLALRSANPFNKLIDY